MNKTIAFLLILITAFGWLKEAKAQAQDEPSAWSDPVNVSKSGSASNPTLIVDSNNQPLLLWEDDFSGFYSSYLAEDSWSEPAAVAMPFSSTESPAIFQYLNGSGGVTYLFWIDSLRRLSFSQEVLTSVAEPILWQKTVPIARNVDRFQVHVDGEGNLHVAYLVGRDTDDQSAGIYYLRITSGGAILTPIVMDQSPYYRTTRQGGLEDQTVIRASFTVWSTGAGPESTVILAWNNPSTKRLYLRKSTNAGGDWGGVEEVVTPDESTVNQVPQMPAFAKIENSILMLWQYNQENVSCKQYYQVSNDLGETWDERQELLSDLFGCPEVNLFYQGSEQKSLLASIINNQLYLTVIDNFQPGPAQLQSELSSFSDPSTYSIIQLKSQQMQMVGDRLYFWGAGAGEFSDIWITYRLVNSLFDTGGQRTIWTNPVPIVQQKYSFRNIALINDEASAVHAFWSQPEGSSNNNPGTAIFYANWNKPEEITPRQILNSPEGKADQPSAAVDKEDRVYVVWSGGKSGEIFLSYSDLRQASSEIDWSSPTIIFSDSYAATNPILKVGLDGILYVAYLVPLNEQRGVYFISSPDRGETWSKPVRIFDAVAEKCDMVDHLSYTITLQGIQYLAWMCSTIPEGTGAYSLSYAYSNDLGQTWSWAQSIQEAQLVWGEVAGLSQEDIHLVWLEYTEGVYKVWDQVSQDGGQTWQPAAAIDTIEEDVGPFALVSDPGGQIFLVLTEQDTGKVILRSWSWNGGSWTGIDDARLISGRISMVNSLAAVALPAGELGVVYSLENPTANSISLYNSLFYLSHPVTIKAAQTNPAPPLVQATVATIAPLISDGMTPSPVETIIPPQPTIDLQALKAETSPRMNNILIYGIGGLLAACVVVLAFIIRRRIP